jgi:ribose transport system substrate-binding protein
VDVRRSVERAAQDSGVVDLIVADNQLDGQTAIGVADRLVSQGLDLLIEYQIDEHAGDVIMARCREASVPVIAVDIPMVGATFFGVDNYRAGQLAGIALANWIVEHWRGKLDRVILLEESRAGSLPAARMRGQLDGLEEVLGPVPEEQILHVDSGNAAETTESNLRSALLGGDLANARRIAVLSFNDDAAVGAIAAARKLGRAGDLIVVGQGADRRARAEMVRRDSRLVGSTAYRPERYGERLIPLALSILRREPAPPAVYMDHEFVSAANLSEFYPDQEQELAPQLASQDMAALPPRRQDS